MHRSILFLLMAVVVSLAGCGESAPELYEVSGTVSVDGVPVLEGEIIFRAVDPQDRSYASRIEAGRFVFKTTPGKKRVEITGYKENPNQGQVADSGEEEPTMIMHVPAQYNIQSTLIETVSPDGPFQFEYNLQSQNEDG